MTALLDSTVVPDWRTAGTVHLQEGTGVSVADPCYRHLDRVEGVTLSAGLWVWEVRDEVPEDAPPARMWEVRLRRSDVDVVADWCWENAYGLFGQDPTEGATVTGYRGVDSGTMAWSLDDPGQTSSVPDVDLLTYSKSGSVFAGGRALTTSTGWGDGVYPLAVRRVDGQVVELRMAFICPDLAPVSAEEFAALVPGAFAVDPDACFDIPPAGRVLMHLKRNTYWTRESDGEGEVEHAFDTLVDVALPDQQVAISQGARTYPDATWDVVYSAYVVAALSNLWHRAELVRKDITQAVVLGAVTLETPQGNVVRSQIQDMTVELTLTLTAGD